METRKVADNHSECDMRVYRVDKQTNSEFLDIDVGGLDRFGRMAGTLHSNSPSSGPRICGKRRTAKSITC
jgi:hypothetical protein